MFDRYRAALALTSLCLLAASPHHRHARHVRHSAPAQAAASIDIYSRRALRRARTILQLKLMELHALQLDRIRQTIERALSRPTPQP